MAGSLLPRHRVMLPDLIDWLGSGFPTLPVRGGPDLHPIPIEVTEEDGHYVVRAELPGMDPEHEIEITAEGDVLTVRAEHTESKQDKQHSEFRYGSFQRSVRLPVPIPEEGVEADYQDGILTVRVPLAEQAKETARSIPVKRPE
ncbi:Hsp20/alpha crystallin family protein [Kitasatospora sp. MAP5-34]|uniref:Hsp20/alpha crystallin family protein n=1 Tax=Kitasatospora sp. MAP5-34 TaxID=3035102 RepID=UPI0024767E3A|nr:Hsp20/alpha crystallin family protein [Kitasatospora sp. MAP5-34]MDH6574710.1 HSP20 family protein [Kitasatospora sp. MAP5-34]